MFLKMTEFGIEGNGQRYRSNTHLKDIGCCAHTNRKVLAGGNLKFCSQYRTIHGYSIEDKYSNEALGTLDTSGSISGKINFLCSLT